VTFTGPDLTDFEVIPAGNFTMGDTLDGLSDATPHTVNVRCTPGRVAPHKR
jgi:hypothetical protein